LGAFFAAAKNRAVKATAGCQDFAPLRSGPTCAAWLLGAGSDPQPSYPLRGQKMASCRFLVLALGFCCAKTHELVAGGIRRRRSADPAGWSSGQGPKLRKTERRSLSVRHPAGMAG
jgi:hypothetical protein